MDKVVLKELSIFARHGLFDAEAELGQRFFIDVEIGADLTRAEMQDTPEGTVNWKDLVETVTDAFVTKRCDMIEAAANNVAEAIFAAFDVAQTVRVEVRKPSAPIEAIFAYTAVIIDRTREEHGARRRRRAPRSSTPSRESARRDRGSA